MKKSSFIKTVSSVAAVGLMAIPLTLGAFAAEVDDATQNAAATGGDGYVDYVENSVDNSSAVSAVNYDAAYASSGITVDGYFDDWEDKPHAAVHYDWQTEYNGWHQVSIVSDGEYVYLHVRMAKTYSVFNGWNYIFTYDIGGQQKQMNIVVPTEYGTSDSLPKGGTYNLIPRYENGYGVIDGASGKLTKYDASTGKSDEAEIKIPMKAFQQYAGLSDSVKEISFYSPNLGPQKVTTQGADTAPYVIAGAGAVIAGTGVIFYTKKKKKSDKNDNDNAEK